MPRPLRYIPAKSTVEVTTRTVQGRMLLRPSAHLNDVVLGVIGRAQKNFPVKIHAFVVMSNHIHFLLTVDHAAQLAKFMGFVNGNIAREIGRLHNWPHKLWSRRYTAIVVADQVSQIARLRYIFANGCKEGFVRRPQDWPGVHCIRALTQGQSLQGTWYDRTAARAAGSVRRRDSRFARQYPVKLSPLPCWENTSVEQQRANCRDLVAAVIADGPVARRPTARHVRRILGAGLMLRQKPDSRPAALNRTSAPFVHACSPERRIEFREQYAVFVAAYRDAAAALRRGQPATFPLGAFPPAIPFVRA